MLNDRRAAAAPVCTSPASRNTNHFFSVQRSPPSGRRESNLSVSQNADASGSRGAPAAASNSIPFHVSQSGNVSGAGNIGRSRLAPFLDDLESDPSRLRNSNSSRPLVITTEPRDLGRLKL